MNFNFSLFFCALGLALVLEALPWLLAPEKMRQALVELLKLGPDKLRLWGLVLLLSGLTLVWLGH